jgi:ornithine cyclodeaminase
MRILTPHDIAAVADVAALIPAIAAAMRVVSAGGTTMPLRTAVPLGGGNRLGVMPGALSDPPGYGAKLLSLFPGNPAQGRSSHAGLVLVFDPQTGLPRGCLDAALVTALRTAAASAVATDTLARPDAKNLAIIGTGEQAGVHLAAIRAVRPIARTVVWGRDATRTHAFATAHGIDAAVSLEEAVGAADIVCTTTAATAPFLTPQMLPPGVHVNAVGGSVPDMRELDAACVAALHLVTDYRPSLEAQAGEVIEARALGLIPPGLAFAEIGEVLAGTAPGRRDAAERTLYRSLGVIAQDLAAAAFLLDRAAALGVGTVVAIE